MVSDAINKQSNMLNDGYAVTNANEPRYHERLAKNEVGSWGWKDYSQQEQQSVVVSTQK